MPDTYNDLATLLKVEGIPRVRISVVTALVEDGKVQTEVTGDAYVATNSDSLLAVGDRVLILLHDTYAVVLARLSGEYPPDPVIPVQPPIGTVSAFAGVADPGNGWIVCDGREVSRTGWAELFAIIGTTYGTGNGTTTFNIPSMARRTVVGADAERPHGTQGGASLRTLTEANTPRHRHLTERGGAKQVASGTGADVITNANTEYTEYTPDPEPFDNMPPFTTMSWIIRGR